jgi:hypothetical protein
MSGRVTMKGSRNSFSRVKSDLSSSKERSTFWGVAGPGEQSVADRVEVVIPQARVGAERRIEPVRARVELR